MGLCDRRKFLGMLGLAPVAGALLGVAPAKPTLFWEGTIVPRHLPIPPGISPANPILIHPFDGYLLMKGHIQKKDEEWWINEIQSNGNDFKLDGLYYRQTTDVEASREARELLA